MSDNIHPVPEAAVDIGEKIVAAAIKLETGVIISLPQPARHHHVAYQLLRAGVPKMSRSTGFLTETGIYVDRSLGWDIAERAGQIIERSGQTPGMLYSEDLW